MTETIALELCTQEFQQKQLKIRLNGFIMNYNNNNYIVTLHHNLPIHEFTIPSKQIKPTIKFNPLWNECIILETEDIKCNLDEYKINSMIQNKLPKINETICVVTETKRYKMITIGLDFIPFDMSNSNYMIPYIKATFVDKIDIMDDFSGLSGSPVYVDNKLVGVFSKYNNIKQIAYIIPIYIIIKIMEKHDNSHVYTSRQTNIKKINNYNVKDNMIYHPTLKQYIPLSSYFLLEGDIDMKYTIHYMDENITTIETNLYPVDNILLSNAMDIITNDELQYKITSRLIVLMKRMIDIEIIKVIWSKIISNPTKSVWISIKDARLKIKLV